MSLLIGHLYRFGPFTIDVDQRILLRRGKPVHLTPKAFDTLLILVESDGRVIQKDELMNRLWPETFVQEANLAFNIQQLRKSLGDRARKPIYIQTVARRGYRFVARVEEVPSDGIGEPSPRGGAVADARSLVASGPPDSQIHGESGHAVDFKESSSAIAPTEDPAPLIGTDAALKAGYKRVVAVAAVVLAGVGVAGLIIWRLSGGSAGKLGKGGGIAAGSSAISPLKFVKLTATGDCPHVAISPDGKYIAYTRGPNLSQTIWLRQLSTNTNLEIVPAAGPLYGLGFANSGEYLYFVRGSPASLYRIALLGGVPTKLVDRLEGNFSLSADESQIAFIRKATDRDGETEYSLMIARSNGGGERALLAGTHPNRLDVPLWSPDGRSIICAHGNWASGSQNVGILEVMAADGTQRELCPHRFVKILKMAWLPDQRGLMLSAATEEFVQLWRLSLPSMQLSQITEGSTSYSDLGLTANGSQAAASQNTRFSDIWVATSREPRDLRKTTQAIERFCWAANGQLVYESMASGVADLWIMRPDGTEQRQLTVNAGSNASPAITSDGRYIVFVSRRTGGYQVWRMNLDGGNQVQLTEGSGGNCPALSPDGKWVIYNTTDNWRLWKVSIDGGEPIPLTDYVASYPSVSPNGRLIACIEGSRSNGVILVLPFEGGQPLKRIDVAGQGLPGPRIQWAPDGKSLMYCADRNGGTAILRQSLEGGPAQEVVSFDQEEIFDFGYSADGRYLALTRGGWQHDAVLITGLP